MDRLPLEVFCVVISLLDYSSILNCSLVCKKWNQSVNQTSVLFETVQCNEFNNHDRIKAFFKQNRHRALRVKTLEYNFRGDMPTAEMEKIQSLFPHVQHFRLFFCDQGVYSSSPHARKYASRASRYQETQRTMNSATPETESIGNWLELKSIQETSGSMYSLTMLDQCQKTYDNLTSIWLNFAHYKPNITFENGMEYLFTGLKNAPALESLTLTYAQVTFDLLDKLHSSCPQLTDLSLIKPAFFKHPTAPDQRFIFDIRPLHYTPNPASSLKNLTMTEVVFVGGIPILEYIAHKYPQIEHLTCNMDLLSHNGPEDLHQAALIILADNCKQLKYLDTNLCKYTSAILEAFHVLQNTLEIKEFSLVPPQTLDTLESLSLTRFNHDVKKMTILLPYFDVQKFCLVISRFTNLTSLEVSIVEDEDYFQDDDIEDNIPLVKLLAQQKHLKKLLLRHCYITIDQDPAGFQTNIEDLSLVDVFIVQPVKKPSYEKQNAVLFQFLSESCLNLKRLHVFGYWHTRTSTDIKLNLFNHSQLSHVDVYIKRHPYIRYLDGQGGERWFEMEPEEDFTTVCYEELEEVNKRLNYLTIECKSVDIFYKPKVYYSEPYRF